MKMTSSVGQSKKREKVVAIFVFTLITLTSVDCIFANGFIIPYSLASRFFKPPPAAAAGASRDTHRTPTAGKLLSNGAAVAQEKLIRTLKGEGAREDVPSRSFVPHVFPFNLPNIGKHGTGKNSNGKKLLKLKLGPHFTSSSSSATPQSISVDLSVLKMSPSSSATASPSSSSFSIASFIPKSSFKPITRPNSHISHGSSSGAAAASPPLSSLEQDSIYEDFLFGDSRPLERNAPSSVHLSNSPFSVASREMREMEESQLRNVLKNLAGATSSSSSSPAKSEDGRQSSRSFFMSRQMNPMRARESSPVISDVTGARADTRSKLNKPFGNFAGNDSPASSLSSSLSSESIISDGNTLRGDLDGESENVSPSAPSLEINRAMDRRIHDDNDRPAAAADDDDEMIRSIARAVGDASSVRDEILRQYQVKIGEKAPDSLFDASSPANSQLNDLINSWYGPAGGDGDALTDFIISQATASNVLKPSERVKTISPHSPPPPPPPPPSHASQVNPSDQSQQSIISQTAKSSP